MSMFGGFTGHLYQPRPGIGQGVVAGSPGPGGFGGPGGFPGVFPGGGVSNSGFAGLQPSEPCTKEDVKTGRCVMGPAAWLSGK
jgi:hypothetical protein